MPSRQRIGMPQLEVTGMTRLRPVAGVTCKGSCHLRIVRQNSAIGEKWQRNVKSPKQYTGLLDDRQHSSEPASLASHRVRRAQPKGFVADGHSRREMVGRTTWVTADVSIPIRRTRGGGFDFHGSRRKPTRQAAAL